MDNVDKGVVSTEKGRVGETGAAGGALRGAECVNPYTDSREHKGKQVEQMFDNIAGAYDFMNTAMTFGLHRYWRNRALSEAAKIYGAAKTPRNILDVATGTGDVAFKLAEVFPHSDITGIDLSRKMLDEAVKKQESYPESLRRRVSFRQGDCLNLPYGENEFDLVTVAYGVRNFEHLAEGYHEMHRVLRPGGVICVIELSRPAGKLTGLMYDFYSHSLIPAAGRMVSGDSRAYTYLPESIAAAPQRDAMTEVMRGAGFDDARWRGLTFGVVTIYTARKK